MNKWKYKSDFEINKAVAVLEGLKVINQRPTPNKSLLIVEGYRWSGSFDPCNNPSDAWRIVESIWDDLMDHAGYEGQTDNVWQDTIDLYGCSKLRAAMIVYIEMNGVEP